MEAAPYTLGDLIDDEPLELVLVTGDDHASERVVAGAQSSEIERPTRWLDRDWVMLMTGVRLSADAEAQRALIAELDEASITALGFALGVVHPEVPAALLEEARGRDFPIFTVPWDTPFRDVISTVYRNVLSQEIRAAHRLAAMQRYLTDAIAEEAPEQTVVERLSALIGARVGVLAAHGEMEVASAPLPGEEIAAAIAARRDGVNTFTTADLQGLAVPLDVPETGHRRWLVIATPQGRALHALARPAAHATRPLFVAMARLNRVQAEANRAVRETVLEALLEADGRQEGAVAAARARACGIDLARGAAAVALVDTATTHAVEEVLVGVEGAAAAACVPLLAAIHGGAVRCLLPASVEPERVLGDLLRERPTLRAGLGRTVQDPLDVAQSLADAELAVNQARHSNGVGSAVVRYDELDFGTVLLNEVSVGRLAPKIREWLEPLQRNPLLHETIVAYLQNDLDVGRTAHALRLHPNSVRYRLRRVEQLIGSPMRSPSTIVALHVALWAKTES